MIFTALLLLLGVSFAAGCEYAKLSNTHTMCVYKGPGCTLIRNGMTKEEEDSVLDIHNELRSKVATGNQTGQPSAANMMQLKWNDELAKIAQRLANQCHDPLSGTSPHDEGKNRVAFAYSSVGQNIGEKWSSSESYEFDVKTFIESFYKEVQYVGDGVVDSFPSNYPNVIGHYTQVVWATSEAVGCGLSRYLKGNNYITQVVCNYGPAGNWEQAKVYEQGEPCSKCPNDCSDQYNGLCLKV